MARQKNWAFLFFLFLTSTPGSFGKNGTSTTNDDTSSDKEPTPTNGHLTIIYFCLTSLLFFHVSCVLLAFILCVRHSTGECRFFRSRSGDSENDEGSVAGGIPHRENSFRISKTLHKDLIAALDGNGSAYTLKFVVYGTPPGQSEEIAFVGYNLPDIDALNKKKQLEDQKQKSETTSKSGKSGKTQTSSESSSNESTSPSCSFSALSNGVCDVHVSNNHGCPAPNDCKIRSQVLHSRSAMSEVSKTTSLAGRIPDDPQSLSNQAASSSSSSPSNETGGYFVRKPLRFSLFLSSNVSSASQHRDGMDGEVPFSGSFNGVRQKKTELQIQKERGTVSLTSRIGSMKKSVFDTFKLATDSISRSTTKTPDAKIKEKNTWRCPICLGDDFLDGVDVEVGEVVSKQRLPCEHEFHADCLSNYIRFNLKLRKGFACPMCRKLFSVSLVTKQEGKK